MSRRDREEAVKARATIGVTTARSAGPVGAGRWDGLRRVRPREPVPAVLDVAFGIGPVQEQAIPGGC